MQLYIKFDISYTCRVVLKEIFDRAKLPYTLTGLNEIDLKQTPSAAQLQEVKEAMRHYGIEVIDDQKSALVQKIKGAIIDMVWHHSEEISVTTSTYLAQQLHHSYGYLSNLFSEVTFTSIENFIILQKIERAKQLLLSEKHTLTEISYLLNYSSVAHLSSQFKKTTGLTPSTFQRIIKKRRENRSGLNAL